MSRMKTMQEKVEDCLQEYPATRDDDKKLIGSIYKLYYDVDMLSPFREILMRDDLPSFETIRRCRQKAQEEHPELRGSIESRNRRKMMEAEVRSYVVEETNGQTNWRFK